MARNPTLLRGLRITALASVDKGANPGAKVLIMKRLESPENGLRPQVDLAAMRKAVADLDSGAAYGRPGADPAQLTKGEGADAFASALGAREAMEQANAVQEAVWTVLAALQRAIERISEDEAITDKGEAIRDATQAALAALPKQIEEEAAEAVGKMAAAVAGEEVTPVSTEPAEENPPAATAVATDPPPPTDPAPIPETGMTEADTPPAPTASGAAGDGNRTEHGMTIQGQPGGAAGTGAQNGNTTDPGKGANPAGVNQPTGATGSPPAAATDDGNVEKGLVTISKNQLDAFEKAMGQIDNLTKRVETAEQAAAAAHDVAKAERLRRETVEFEKRATEEFPHLGAPADIAKTLRRITAIEDEAERNRELSLLKSANEAYRLATVEKGVAMVAGPNGPVAAGGADVQDEIQRKAGELVAKGEAKTKAEAIRKVMATDRDLAERYRMGNH